MDDGFWFIVGAVSIILTLVLSVGGLVVHHELSETPYKKCLDACVGVNRDNTMRLDCIKTCSIHEVDSKEEECQVNIGDELTCLVKKSQSG